MAMPPRCGNITAGASLTWIATGDDMPSTIKKWSRRPVEGDNSVIKTGERGRKPPVSTNRGLTPPLAGFRDEQHDGNRAVRLHRHRWRRNHIEDRRRLERWHRGFHAPAATRHQ